MARQRKYFHAHDEIPFPIYITGAFCLFLCAVAVIMIVAATLTIVVKFVGHLAGWW